MLHDTTSDVVSRMAHELETSVRGLLSRSRVVFEMQNATDIVVLLTRHVLDDDSRSFKELFKAITTLQPSMLTFIYLNVGDEAWDWSLPSKVSIDDADVKSKFSSSIYGREAYIWRGAEAPHEHFALTRDIVLKRFVRRVEEEEEDDVDIEECSSDDDSSVEEKVEDGCT